MKKIFLETRRVCLRYMTTNDFEDLKQMLQDSDVMYAWEYTFSDTEVQRWIDKNLERYEKYNLGFFMIEDTLSGEIIGQAALMPDIINNQQYYEIGYMLKKQYWNKGYATEAAKALVDYAFEILNLPEVIFEIRPENISSRKVAEALNANIEGKFIKTVKDKEMVHLIYKLYR